MAVSLDEHQTNRSRSPKFYPARGALQRTRIELRITQINEWKTADRAANLSCQRPTNSSVPGFL